MFIPNDQGAPASTDFVTPTAATPAVHAAQPSSTPPIPREQIRHLLLGTLTSVKATIRLLHKLGYAEPNDWSRPISTGRPNEMMAILTKRVIAE